MKASRDFPYHPIRDQKELDAFVDEASHSPRLALDTEFLARRTYRARLCLIQIARSDGKACLIDPLDPAINLAPVLRLINNDGIVKILHAGQQDLAILYHLGGTIPRPVFDTQIGATMCGMGQEMSLSALLHKLTGQRLDKDNQLSDWSQRPLSEKQIDYALNDVVHLHRIHDLLIQRLRKKGRLEWAVQECADTLGHPRAYDPDPDQAWRKLRMAPAAIGRFSARQWRLVCEIAAWRERRAIERNVPRTHVIADKALTTLAVRQPATIEQLRKILSPNIGDPLGRSLLKVLAEGSAKPPLTPPSFQPIQSTDKSLISLLNALLHSRSHQHQIPPSLIASRRDLYSLIEKKNDSPILKGWRRDVFGRDALRLCQGTLALSIRNGQIHQSTPAPQTPALKGAPPP